MAELRAVSAKHFEPDCSDLARDCQ